MQTEWFASWFDSPHYHRLYAHRDEAEAAGFIDALVARLQPRPGARALDLGCGAGRHARQLASKGLDTTGIDLSPRSIAEAARSAGPGLRFRRQDMRRPFGSRRFDYVFNLFTSFGYFATDADHDLVVRNMATALAPGGCLVLDYLNVPNAERHLTCHDVRRIDGVTYRVSRWLERTCFVKRIDIEKTEGHVEQHMERVARLTLADFARLFAAHDLTIEQVYGDYRLGPFDVQTSPRVILVARKEAGRLLPRQLFPDAAHGLGRHAQV